MGTLGFYLTSPGAECVTPGTDAARSALTAVVYLVLTLRPAARQDGAFPGR